MGSGHPPIMSLLTELGTLGGGGVLETGRSSGAGKMIRDGGVLETGRSSGAGKMIRGGAVL